MRRHRLRHPAAVATVAALLVALVAVVLVLAAARDEPVAETIVDLVRPEPVERDLEDIREEGVLRLLVTTDSTSYFLYRGTPMGYDYGILKRFANEHELALEVVLVDDREELVERLDRGDGDVGAARLIPDYEDVSGPAYTLSLFETPPTLVQREGPPLGASPTVEDTLAAGPPGDPAFDPERRGLEPMEISVRLLRRRADVAGEQVAVPETSEYSERALELFDVEGGEVEVVEVEDAASYEALIRQVARGEIRLAASPRNIASLKESYFSNLVVYPTLGPIHPVAWAVRRNAPDLLTALNAFLAQDGELPRFDELYERYFIDRQGYREREASEYLTSVTGRLSPYDDLLRSQAGQLGWDWRLLASQTYQESRFDPDAESWAGAGGLLQLMPATAKQFQVANRFDPEDNVGGAVRFLDWLLDYWEDKIADPDQRLRFVLASYNAGHGHLLDARRLAAKHGDDPDVWDDVAYWLIQLSKQQYYTDPVVKYGFCRGLEPVTYVERILDRWAHYRNFVEGGVEVALQSAHDAPRSAR